MAPTTKPTTSSRRIRATSLDPASFAAFGEVVQNPATHGGAPQNVHSVSANQGTATKWLDVAHISNFYPLGPSRKPANVVVNMFVCQPRELEAGSDGNRTIFPVKILERHPFTPQMFVPLGVCPNNKRARYLVIVAPTLPTKGSESARQPPPYPTDTPRRKRSLKDILLGCRPNPFTNDHASSTTPPATSTSSAGGPVRKGPGPPDLSKIQAFIATGDQAVTYGPGTWHAPMVALGEKAMDFVVVQFSNGVGVEDCQEVEVGGVEVDVDGVVKAKL